MTLHLLHHIMLYFIIHRDRDKQRERQRYKEGHRDRKREKETERERDKVRGTWLPLKTSELNVRVQS